jgi:prolipoprotein diacylglyceryltransferase
MTIAWYGVILTIGLAMATALAHTVALCSPAAFLSDN